ncbi:membrane protein [Gordonia phage Periwinkle]|nr:membrane protein [Gordonia phage Periwinkle]
MSERQVVTPPLSLGLIPPSAPPDVREAITNCVPGRYRGNTRNGDWEVWVYADGSASSRQSTWATTTFFGQWRWLAVTITAVAWVVFGILVGTDILKGGWAAGVFIGLDVLLVALMAWFIWLVTMGPLPTRKDC